MQNYRGKQIDHYLILNPVGLGGMALVYKAYDLQLEQDVALKMIRTDEIPPSQLDRLMKRFEREAKAQSRFTHPNIVPVYDYGKFEGVPYLVLKYLPGGTLKERMDGPFAIEETLRILIPISDAVAYAHSKNVLHRDIKPSNIIFDHEDQPLLADFGIAKVLEANEGTLTGTGLGVGTPEYMAPEQWQGKASEASDQYALGVLLYELLTGIKPFTAETPLAVALKQINDPLIRPTDLVPGIPLDVEHIIIKTMARKPEDRFTSVNELRDRLIVLAAEFAPALKTKPAEEIATEAEKEQAAEIQIAIPESVSKLASPQFEAAAPVEEPSIDETVDSVEPESAAPETESDASAAPPEIKAEVLPAPEVQVKKEPKRREKSKRRAETKPKAKPAFRSWGLIIALLLLAGITWGGISLLLKSDFLRNTNNQPESAALEVTATFTPETSETETVLVGAAISDTPANTATATETATPTATSTFTPTATFIYIPPTNTSAPVINDPAPAPTTAPQPTDDPDSRPPTPTPP